MSIVVIDSGGGIMRPGGAAFALRNGPTKNPAETIRKLRKKLENYHRRRARRAGWIRRFIPTSLTALDTALPHGGLPCGAITEILSDGKGVGSMALAMRIASRCIGHERHDGWHGQAEARPSGESSSGKADKAHTPSRTPSANQPQDHRSIIVVDTLGDFYPPAAGKHGIALDRIIIIRTRNEKDALWAVDQSLRCPGIAAVVAPLTRLDDRLSRRLQLAAESSGCLGLILRPVRRRVKSFAAVRMLLESVPHEESIQPQERNFQVPTFRPTYTTAHGLNGADKRSSPLSPQHVRDACLCRITLMTVREGMPTEPLLVDLQHETGALPLHPLPVDRSVAKTG